MFVTSIRLSIIIPARNEELLLPRALAAIRAAAQFYQDLSYEVIVVLNRCTDRTEEIAREHGCRIVKEDSKNLSIIRNAGAQAALGELVITVDADSVMSRNMFQEVDRALSNPDIVGGGVMIWPERWSLGIVCTGLALLPIALRHRISCGLFFCRKADFFAIGGFNPELVSVEDIDFAKRLKAHGRRSRRRFT
ncbi:MAG: glycosyltransferase, partial [Proteobacteria bacterium]|nr:glycosyltransferase [Pseudomonadota bacterium]